MKNTNGGYSAIELILSIAIFVVIGIFSMGMYHSFMNDKSEEILLIYQSIIKTQQKGRNMSVDKYIYNGVSGKQPFIVFDGDSYFYTDTEENKLVLKNQNIKNNLKLTTNVPNKTIYFNSNGHPEDDKGNKINNVHIYLTSSDNKVTTFNINCNGKIETIEKLDDTPLSVCKVEIVAE